MAELSSIAVPNIPVWIWTIIAVQTILLLVLMLFLASNRKKTVKLISKNDVLTKDNENLKRENIEAYNVVKQYIDNIKDLYEETTEILKEPGQDGVSRILGVILKFKIWNDDGSQIISGNLDIMRRDAGIAERKAAMMDILRDKVLRPLHNDLVNSTLDANNCARLRGELISSAFKMMDGVQSVFEALPKANDIQLDVLRGKTSFEEAIEKASIVTNLLTETEKWAIKLNSIIQGMNLPAGTYLLKGYRFEISERQ